MAVLLNILLFYFNTLTASLPLLLLPCVDNMPGCELFLIWKIISYWLRIGWESQPYSWAFKVCGSVGRFSQGLQGTFPTVAEYPVLIICPKALGSRFSNSCKMTCYRFLNSLLEMTGSFKLKLKIIILSRCQDWTYSCLNTWELAIEERIIESKILVWITGIIRSAAYSEIGPFIKL